MNVEIVLCGCKKGTFFVILRHNEADGNHYYVFFTESGTPKDFSLEAIVEFLEENADYGGSVAGNYEQIMEELMEFLGGENSW